MHSPASSGEFHSRRSSDEDFGNLIITASGMKKFRSKEASASADAQFLAENAAKCDSQSSEDPFVESSTETDMDAPADAAVTHSGRSSIASENKLEDIVLGPSSLDALERRLHHQASGKSGSGVVIGDSCSNPTAPGHDSSTDPFENITDSDAVSDHSRDSQWNSTVSGCDDTTRDDDHEYVTDESLLEEEQLIPSKQERREFELELAGLDHVFLEAQKRHDEMFKNVFADPAIRKLLSPSAIEISDTLRSDYLSTTFGNHSASSTPASPNHLQRTGSSSSVVSSEDHLNESVLLDQYKEMITSCIDHHFEALRTSLSLTSVVSPRRRSGQRGRADKRRARRELISQWEREVFGHMQRLLQSLEASVKLFIQQRSGAAGIEKEQLRRLEQRIVERLVSSVSAEHLFTGEVPDRSQSTFDGEPHSSLVSPQPAVLGAPASAVEKRLATLTSAVRSMDDTISKAISAELRSMGIGEELNVGIQEEVEAVRSISSQFNSVGNELQKSELELMERRLTKIESQGLGSSASSHTSVMANGVASLAMILALSLFLAEIWLMMAPGVSRHGHLSSHFFPT